MPINLDRCPYVGTVSNYSECTIHGRGDMPTDICTIFEDPASLQERGNTNFSDVSAAAARMPSRAHHSVLRSHSLLFPSRIYHKVGSTLDRPCSNVSCRLLE